MKQKDKASFFDMYYENYLGYLKDCENEYLDKTPLTEEEFGNMLGELIMDRHDDLFKFNYEEKSQGERA